MLPGQADTTEVTLEVKRACATVAVTLRSVHAAINEAFETRFGPFAGWAHNILFVSHLREYNKRLPEHLQSPPTPSPNAKAAKRKEHAKALKAKAARAGAAEEEAPEPKKASKMFDFMTTMTRMYAMMEWRLRIYQSCASIGPRHAR